MARYTKRTIEEMTRFIAELREKGWQKQISTGEMEKEIALKYGYSTHSISETLKALGVFGLAEKENGKVWNLK